MRAEAALAWLRAHNALVRFESNGTVSVTVSCYKRRRATLDEAVHALRVKLEPAAVLAEQVERGKRKGS